MADKKTIARPYGVAVFEIAKTAGRIEDWRVFLATLESITLNEDFSRLIGNPLFSVELVNEVILGSFLNAPDADQKNFIKLLLTSRRIRIFREIKDVFDALSEEDSGVLTAEVSTPYMLTDEEKRLIELEVRNKFGKNCVLEISVLPELIGGILIKVGDSVVDLSIKGRLGAFARHMQ